MKLFFLLVASVGLISCSTLKVQTDEDHLNMAEVDSIEVQNELRSELARELPDKNEVVHVKGVPQVSNKYVDKWLDYFQNRGHDLMTRYLQRSARYIPVMKQVLREHGLPEELIYIALIESGFTSQARSHAGAVGYWQFLRGTARDFGLQVDDYVDERQDPIRATEAAARYLKGVYFVFGSWYLAIASYNVGHNRLKSVVMREHTRDFWELIQRKKLPRETLNYVPKFLAAWKIGENPKNYGFTDLDYQSAMSFDEVIITRPVSLSAMAKNAGIAMSEMKALNPAFRTDYVPLGRNGKRVLRVPRGERNAAIAAISKSYFKPPQRSSSHASTYKVRRGDTLSEIAEKHRMSLSTLRRLNGLGSHAMIRIGQNLKVAEGPTVAKRSSRSSRSVVRSRSQSRSQRSRSSAYYTVRRGDNLISIARRNAVSLRQLQQINGLSRGSMIRIGQRLKIPAGDKRVHKVERGETLIGIANQYGITLTDLRKANRLGSRSRIYVGANLEIPL